MARRPVALAANSPVKPMTYQPASSAVSLSLPAVTLLARRVIPKLMIVLVAFGTDCAALLRIRAPT
jgi:hypothetical protein